GDRLPADELAAFLANPHARYPDGRMPRLPLTPDMARNIAAYLLLWSKTVGAEGKLPEPPTAAEIRQVTRRLGGQDLDAATAALIRQKGCAVCHPGLGPSAPTDVPLTVTEDSRGCLSGKSLPRFIVDASTREAMAAYRVIAAKENHVSPFAA